MRVIAAICGFVIGMSLGLAGTLGIHLFQTTFLGRFDREGAQAMTMTFFVAPLAGLALGACVAVIAWQSFGPERPPPA